MTLFVTVSGFTTVTAAPCTVTPRAHAVIWLLLTVRPVIVAPVPTVVVKLLIAVGGVVAATVDAPPPAYTHAVEISVPVVVLVAAAMFRPVALPLMMQFRITTLFALVTTVVATARRIVLVNVTVFAAVLVIVRLRLVPP